jgi:hypothetical protein
LAGGLAAGLGAGVAGLAGVACGVVGAAPGGFGAWAKAGGAIPIPITLTRALTAMRAAGRFMLVSLS